MLVNVFSSLFYLLALYSLSQVVVDFAVIQWGFFVPIRQLYCSVSEGFPIQLVFSSVDDHVG